MTKQQLDTLALIVKDVADAQGFDFDTAGNYCEYRVQPVRGDGSWDPPVHIEHVKFVRGAA